MFLLLLMKKPVQDVSEWAAQSETVTFIVQVDRVREKKQVFPEVSFVHFHFVLGWALSH